LTMNRPEAKNAWSLEMMARLADAWETVNTDDSIFVCILTGAGGSFCAGSDLKMMHRSNDDDPWKQRFKDDPNLHWKAMLRGHRVTKPIISAVEGFALAGGTEILQTTDIRVAARDAQFGLTEAKLGLFPLGGSTVRLQRQVSYTKAMEILLMGQRFSAQEALDIGLIGRIVEPGEALEEARRMAAIIAGNGPLAVQAIKKSIVETADMSEEDGLAHELKLGWPVFQSEDAREGARAFAEKRQPVFKGK
ncbi:MAG: enoyl-CoA hydratase, partial [Myxococcota bacterium]